MTLKRLDATLAEIMPQHSIKPSNELLCSASTVVLSHEVPAGDNITRPRSEAFGPNSGTPDGLRASLAEIMTQPNPASGNNAPESDPVPEPDIPSDELEPDFATLSKLVALKKQKDQALRAQVSLLVTQVDDQGQCIAALREEMRELERRLLRQLAELESS